MRKSSLIAVSVVIGVAAYYYFSPYLALHALRTAIQDGDSAALSERIDFVQLRESLKGQIKAAMLKESMSELKDNSLGALGLGLASTLVGGMVDSYVTPVGLAGLLQGAQPTLASSGDSTTASSHLRNSSNDCFANARLSRDSLDRFSMRIPGKDGGETQFVFRRRGLSWRLTDIFLPHDA